MRIAFLTNRTTQYSLPVLKRLVGSEGCEVVHVFFYDTLKQGQKKLWSTVREFGVSGLLAKISQVVSGKIRMVWAKSISGSDQWAHSSYEYAVLKKLPHSVIQDINRPENRDKLDDLKIDLLVVAICKNILKDDVLQIPRCGAINIHPSLLPKYRGPTPAFWALYFGESETGVTFHQMTTKIDVGSIVGQYPFAIKAGWTEHDINRFAFELAADHMEDVLLRISNQQLQEVMTTSIPEASYFSYPSPSQRRELRDRQKTK